MDKDFYLPPVLLSHSMESPNTTDPSLGAEDAEISPVQAKMSKLTSRSSFASFFCKTKRPVSAVTVKSDPFLENNVVEVEIEVEASVKTEPTDFNEEVQNCVKREKITEPAKTEPVVAPQNPEPVITLISSASSSSDSDIQIISVNNPVITIKDDDVISISSEDSDPPVQRIRRPTAPKGPPVKFPNTFDTSLVRKFSDYSDMKKGISFTPPRSIPAAAPPKPKPASSVTTRTDPVSSYLDPGFTDLDPSLRDELMARLSQKSQDKPTSEPVKTDPISYTNINNTLNSLNTLNTETDGLTAQMSTSITSTKTNVSATNESVITFKVFQRLNPGTFDPSKSPTGQLLPSTNFIVYWKSSDTFGALKQRIAATLKTSPFDLVLVNGKDQMELFDATRPSTLNLIGLNLQEYSKMQELQALTSKAAKARAPRKNSKTQEHTNALASALQGLHSVPPVTIYLYTKSSYAHFNDLQQKKRRQIYDSLSFLQTAEEEISKLTVVEDEGTLGVLSLEGPHLSQFSGNIAPSEITINVKTAVNRNQSYSIKVPTSSEVSDILTIFASSHNQPIGTKVIFDGEVLKNDSLIDGLLEDDDMIEIK